MKRRGSIDTGVGALWASAFVILALTVVQAGRLTGVPGGAGFPGAGLAYAGNVSEIGDLTILTAASGNDEDVLLVLDRRSESLFVYGVQNRNAVDLMQTYDLGVTYSDARGAAGLGGVWR